MNFWTPSDRRRFSAPEFSPFFFKLKAPHRAIVGFAFFAKWSSLPDWLAWECFGEGNGCESLAALKPSWAEARSTLASMLIHLGFQDDAERQLQKSIALDPESHFAPYRQPRVLWQPQRRTRTPLTR